jgi:TolB-like protein/DNA-binding winged helix-turn-helix (wHTH) protein
MSNNSDNSQASHLAYFFGDFCLDTRRGALCRDRELVPLRPKSYSVLVHLLRHHGELVTRTDLLDTVWHNATVSDDSITQCIVDIRKAIEDTDHTMLRTIPRRGFVFEAPVEERPAEEHPDAPATPAPAGGGRNARRWSWAAVSIVLVVVSAGLWTVAQRHEAEPRPPVSSKPSIAVLAFADMTETGDRQYFADGVAEEILNHLSRSPDLRVVSRSSSFTFRDDEKDIPTISERLGVDFVLEGSVRGSGDQLRITAQLIDAGTDEHVWADAYDRELAAGNLIGVQNDIAANVAAAIGVQTGTTPSLPAEAVKSVDPEAMDKFLRGLFYVHRIGSGSVEETDYESAIELMNAAIELEPEWAQPHAAIGTALHFFATSYFVEASEVDAAFEASRRHLLDAIRLDPTYGPAYGSLAFIAHAYDLDFERAEAFYARAEQLGNRGRWGYAIMLRSQGRFEEAIEKYREAMLHNPMSTGLTWQLADSLRCAGRYEEAAGHIDGLLKISPDNRGMWEFRALLAVRMGENDLARQLLDEHGESDDPLLFANVRAALGMRDAGLAALEELDRRPGWFPQGYAMIAVPIGEAERALAYLERVAAEEPRLLTLATCPDDFGPIVDDPRYVALFTEAGIPLRLTAASR